MAVSAAQAIAVGTGATKLAENLSRDKSDDRTRIFTAINVTATATIVLGPAGVTTATGLRWTTALGPVFDFELEPGEALYGVVASGSQSVDVIGGGN
jgi:hypothetical protein